MNKRGKGRFVPVILVMAGFCLLGTALYGRDALLNYKAGEPAVSLLEPGDADLPAGNGQPGKSGSQTENGSSTKLLPGAKTGSELESPEPECLFLWDSEDENSRIIAEDMTQVFKDMKVKVLPADIRAEDDPDYRDFHTVVVAFGDYSAAGDLFIDLMDWTDGGGRLLILCPPTGDAVFRSFSQKLGIQSYKSDFYQVPGIRILDDFMLHGDKTDYMIEEPFQSSLLLRVSEDSQVYLVSADQKEIPLLWSRTCGRGKLVYDNIGIYEKNFRGFHCAAYSLLEDVCVYPVINGMAFYMDDFPGPTPSGKNFYIDRDYGISTADFYSKTWWPDMVSLMKKYGIRGTGMMIASFDTETEPPYTGSEGAGKYRYYGNMILEDGGEIGIHGFNHQPLVKKGFEKEFSAGQLNGLSYEKDFKYQTWADDADITAALRETDRLYRSIFAEETARVYSPPDNILSEECRRILPQALPEIRAVAGSYLPDPYIHDQEFEVAGDGIVETPRISSGFKVEEGGRLSAVSELNLHFVSTHSVRPEDILDTEKGANEGWGSLKTGLDQYLDWIFASGPGLRALTGSELAAAVQRFYYVDVKKTETEGKVSLELGNLEDEAWFFVRMNQWSPRDLDACVRGGRLRKLSGNLYLLKAEEPHVEIVREVE